MIDIQAGDVVVCVDDQRCRCGCGDAAPVRRPSLYRVEAIIPPDETDQFWAFRLCGVNHATRNHPHGDGIGSDRFRKVTKADEGFATWMRSLSPSKREKQDA